MSCETWAPESEKVTTVRGCLHHLERDVLVLVRDRLKEEEVEVLLEREVDHRLDRIAGRARARSRPPSGAARPPCPTRRASRSRPGRASVPSALRLSRSRGGLDQLLAQLGVAQLASAARRAGARGCSFHTGSRSNGSWVLNESTARERPAVHLGEHAPARARRSRRAARRTCCHMSGASLRRLKTPNVIGRPVSTARSRSRVWYSRTPGSLDLAVHALAGELEDAGVQLAHRADQPPHLAPRRPCGSRPAGRRASRGSASARS